VAIITLIAGGLLSLVGVLGYALSESRSLTALIPVAFGLLLDVAGALALRPELKKHAMHGASMVALLGTVGAAPGAVSFIRLISGTAIARPLAAQQSAAMFLICATLLVLCIRSFRAARARRALEGRPAA
jgi:hypothetical protein